MASADLTPDIQAANIFRGFPLGKVPL